MKYALQVYDVEADVPEGPLVDGACRRSSTASSGPTRRRFGDGVGYPEGGVDLAALRLHVEAAEPLRARPPTAPAAPASPGRRASARCYWPERGAASATPVYTGADLQAGTRVDGPALIDYPDTTVVVRPGLRLTVEPGGNLTIEMED